MEPLNQTERRAIYTIQLSPIVAHAYIMSELASNSDISKDFASDNTLTEEKPLLP